METTNKAKTAVTMGERIRKAREAVRIRGKPMSQGELGRRIGVQRASVSQWESGTTKSIKGEHLIKLARELNQPQEYLLHGKEGRRMEVSDKANELAHAWDDMPEGEWKERVFYFVTTFLVFQKHLAGEQKLRSQVKKPKNHH